MEFKTTMNIKELAEGLSDFEKRQLPFAVKEAINKTAKQVQEESIKAMQSTLDRPTPYALNSLYIKYATKRDLSALVYYKDKRTIVGLVKGGTPAAYFMQPQAEGGRRDLKRFESALQQCGVLPRGMYIVPGAACPRDAYGNIPHGLIMQVLSYFEASERWAGHTSDMTALGRKKLKKGTKKKQGFVYFVSKGKGEWFGRQQHLPAGIYKRIEFSNGSAIKPIMMFVKNPMYHKRFPFFETTQKVVDKNLDDNFYKSFDEAMKTAK